jgi:hypothetical protein
VASPVEVNVDDLGFYGTASTSLLGPFTFDSGTEQWSVRNTTPAGMTATVNWDGGSGYPDVGALKVEVPFSDINQGVNVGYLPGAGLDLCGHTLHASFQLQSGGAAVYPGGTMLYVTSGPSFTWASGAWTNVNASTTWIDLAFAPDASVCTDIRQIGVQYHTGSMAGTTVTPAVILVDTIYVD